MKRAIQQLKKVMMKSHNLELNDNIPEDFKCFISKKLMRDPVILETGWTYDRTSIVDYLSAGNDKCPKSETKIVNKEVMVPNLILKKLISDWCKNNGVVPPKTETELQIDLLIMNLPKDLLELRKICAEALVFYTNQPKRDSFFRTLKEPIKLTLCTLLENLENLKDPEYQVDLATLILNLSEIEDLRRVVGESRNIIPFIIESLKESKPMEAKFKACQILIRLSEVESNMKVLVNSETANALLRLLSKSDTIRLVGTVVTTLIKLCRHESFFKRAIDEGMHRLALLKLKHRPVYEVMYLQILTLFLESPDILIELITLDAAPVLMSIIMKLNGGTEEPALGILYAMCEVNEDLINTFRADPEFEEALYDVVETCRESTFHKAIEIIAKMKQESTESIGKMKQREYRRRFCCMLRRAGDRTASSVTRRILFMTDFIGFN